MKFKQSKHWHFSKGVNPWFWSKNGPFLTFFLWNIGQENVFYGILEQKKALSRLSKQEVQKVEKLTFLHGVGLKMAFFSNFYCLCNIGQENVFYDILERINPFLGHKNKKFKKSKNWHFSKGVIP